MAKHKKRDFKQVKKAPPKLLKAQQEEIDEIRNIIGFIKPLSKHNELELIKKSKNNCDKSTHELLQSQLNYICKLASYYVGMGLCVSDLIGYGMIGFLTAIERFDVKKKLRLNTYATWWIKEAITQALLDNGKTIRVPNVPDAQRRKFSDHMEVLESQLGRKPHLLDISEYFNLSLENTYKLVVKHNSIPKVILADITEPNSSEPQVAPSTLLKYKTQVSYTEPTYGDKAEDTMMLIDKLISSVLDERERAVIQHRFGLKDKQFLTLEELGKLYNCTKERIRQIEKLILTFLKEELEIRNHTEHLIFGP